LRAARPDGSAGDPRVDEDAVRVCNFGLGSDSLLTISSRYIFDFLSEGQDHAYVYDLHGLRDCIVRGHRE
jgi:hypothetical protein